MPSRQDILANIRRQQVPSVDLPDHAGPWIRYDDPIAKFSEVLGSVGGETHVCHDRGQLKDLIAGLPCLADAKQIVSCVEGVRELGNVNLDAIDDPHDVEAVDVAILPGEFAVAENAAIWVDTRAVKHRALYFLTQHLILVVPRDQIVHNLHEAYQRISFENRTYGLFISGPSKTADIEQSLVIGAHGPRSMMAVLA